jgi:hypothetical protein
VSSKTQNSDVVIFEVVQANSGVVVPRSISYRESRRQRVNRVSELFATFFPLTFLSAFAGKIASAFAAGKMISFPDGAQFNRETPTALLCPVCLKYHGQPTKGSPNVESKNLPRNAIFQTATGRVISLSQTCLETYILPIAKAYGKGDVRQAIKGLDKFADWYPFNAVSKAYRLVSGDTSK